MLPQITSIDASHVVEGVKLRFRLLHPRHDLAHVIYLYTRNQCAFGMSSVTCDACFWGGAGVGFIQRNRTESSLEGNGYG